MRIIFWMMVFGLVLTGCQPKTVPQGPWVKKIDSEEMTRLVLNYSKELKIRRALDLEDSWVSYDDSIKKICLEYSSQRLLTLEEARLLMVELVEGFLERLNNNAFLSYELETFPFTADNLSVRINFESFFGMYVDILYIGQVWLQAGCVDFYAFDRKIDGIDWDHHRFEPYTKSREIALLKKEADLPYMERPNPPKKPSEYIYDRYERYRPNNQRSLPFPMIINSENYPSSGVISD